MDNSEKLAIQGTQDKEKQNKNHNTICTGQQYTQTITNNVNTSYKQQQVKTNRTSFLYGNRILHKFGNIFFATGRQCPFPNKV
jgi:hypothetical protein